jgi:hypothetical protein
LLAVVAVAVRAVLVLAVVVREDSEHQRGHLVAVVQQKESYL